MAPNVRYGMTLQGTTPDVMTAAREVEELGFDIVGVGELDRLEQSVILAVENVAIASLTQTDKDAVEVGRVGDALDALLGSDLL